VSIDCHETRLIERYELDDRGSIPGRSWKFLSSPPCPDRLWGPSNLLSNGCRGFPRIKVAGASSWPLTSI